MKRPWPTRLLWARRKLRQVVAIVKPIIALAAVVAMGAYLVTKDPVYEAAAWFLMLSRWALD